MFRRLLLLAPSPTVPEGSASRERSAEAIPALPSYFDSVAIPRDKSHARTSVKPADSSGAATSEPGRPARNSTATGQPGSSP